MPMRFSHSSITARRGTIARMCLLAISWKTHPRWRLLLAGNRDEFHERPTAPLAAWSEPAGVLAGRDLRSGGTWVGLDQRGRCAVVTNVRDPSAPAPQGPSRGALPAGFLGTLGSAADQAEELMVSAHRFAPFNLLLADADSCQYLGNHPAPKLQPLSAGVHGLSNGALDEPWPKTRRLCQVMADHARADDTDLEPLWQALADERIAADSELPATGVSIEWERLLSAAFIRGEHYGTRASTLIAIDHAGHGWIHERRFGPHGVFSGETRLSIGPDPT